MKTPFFPVIQVVEILDFIEVLSRHLTLKDPDSELGVSARSHNGRLMASMDDVRRVADLQALSLSGTADNQPLQAVEDSLRRLESCRMLPATGVSPTCLRAARDALPRAAAASGPPLSNQQLFTRLWRASRAQPELRPYVDTVTRLWLISPSSGVIRDLAGTVREALRDV